MCLDGIQPMQHLKYDELCLWSWLNTAIISPGKRSRQCTQNALTWTCCNLFLTTLFNVRTTQQFSISDINFHPSPHDIPNLIFWLSTPNVQPGLELEIPIAGISHVIVGGCCKKWWKIACHFLFFQPTTVVSKRGHADWPRHVHANYLQVVRVTEI